MPGQDAVIYVDSEGNQMMKNGGRIPAQQELPGFAAPTLPFQQGEGAKHDGGKLRWSLLMRGMGPALAGIVQVLMFGAQKYAADSWQTVPDGYERYKDALYRHLASVEEKGPSAKDEESGLPEWWHIGCCTLFCIWFALKGKV